MNVLQEIISGFRSEIIARILYFATTGATLIILARFLSPDAYGIVFLALAILSIGEMLSDLSIPESAAKYIAEYKQSDPNRISYIITFSFGVVLVASSVVAITVIVFHRQIASLFDEPALGGALLVGSAMVFCQAFYWYFRKILQGFKFVRPSAAVYGGEGVGRLVFVVIFLVLGFGTTGAIGGYMMGYVVAALIGMVLFYHYVYPTIDISFDRDRDTRNRIIKYAVPLISIRSARIIDNDLDTIIVGFFLAPAAVGFYTLSKQASHLLQAPASALGFSSGPWFGDQKVAGNTQKIAEIYSTSITYTLLLYVPAAVGLIVLANHALLIIFGQEYVPATNVLQIFAIFAVLQSIEEVSENSIDYLGRARERSIARMGTAVTGVAAIAILVPIVGIIGAAAAKVATHTVYVAALLYIMHTEVSFDSKIIAWNVIQIVSISAVMGVVVLFASNYITGFVTLFGVIAVGGVIWLVISVYVGLLDKRVVLSLVD